MNKPKVGPTNVELGDFPFPLTDGPEESRYLTWIRNHSNYMAVRGFLDYVRMVGVLVRGIVVNFLIFLPYLLAVALLLGYSHHWMLERPFRITLIVLGVAVAWILLFPVLMPLFKIFSYKKSLETGSESSVWQRDLYERSFGGLLFAIFAVGILESLPWLLELRNDLFNNNHFGWKGSVASVAGALALLSGSDKLFSILKGAKRKVAMVLIGILGLLVPLLVILYTADFLVYGLPPSPNVMYSPLAIPIVSVLGIMVAIPLGLVRRAFSLKECIAVTGLLAAGFVVIVGVVMGINSAVTEGQKGNDQLINIIDPLERVAAQFEKISPDVELNEKVAELVDEVIVADRQYKRRDKELRQQIEQYMENAPKTSTSGTGNSDGADSVGESEVAARTWTDFFVDWGKREQLATTRGEYFKLGQRFITLGDELASQPRGSLEPLRREVARLAYANLLDELEQIVRAEKFQQKAAINFLNPLAPADWFGLEPETHAEVTKLLRRNLIQWYLLQEIQARNAQNVRQNTDEIVSGDLEAEVAAVRKRLNELGNPKQVLDAAIPKALIDLQNWELDELVTLTEEDELFAAAKKIFDNDEPEHARLEGKTALAKLIPKGDLYKLALGFYKIPKEETQLLDFVQEQLVHIALPTWHPDMSPQQKLGIANKLAVLTGGMNVVEVSGADGDAAVSSPTSPYAIAQPGNREAWKKLPVSSIGRAAAIRFASLNVQHLGVVARHGINVYGHGSSHEIEHFKKDGEDARHLPLNILVSRALDAVKHEVEKRSDKLTTTEQTFPNVYKLQLVYLALNKTPASAADDESVVLKQFARAELVKLALNANSSTPAPRGWRQSPAQAARNQLRTLYEGELNDESHPYSAAELSSIAMAKFAYASAVEPDKLVATLMFGKYGPLERGEPGTIKIQGALASIKKELTEAVFQPKAIFIFLLAAVVWLAGCLTVDVNMTSIHGLYRDRLASAFLVGQDTAGDVDIEEDIDLEDICRYEARSTAPYHLVNVALNLQGSKDIGVRDRNSDFFIFSKRFIGGQRTGYCRSGTMEQVFPQMSLATAMAISAAAASPNMGRSTSRLLVAFMTLLNIRLGYWTPNPGLLEEHQDLGNWKERRYKERQNPQAAKEPMGYTFDEVFAEELKEIERRWEQVDPEGAERRSHTARFPTVEHGFVGIGFSGGGIRSATINLGIAQTLHRRGVFRHIDYMSTVSGGGYLGSSISALMRSRTRLESEIAGTVKVETEKLASEIAGTVTIKSSDDYQIVEVTPSEESDIQGKRSYRFSKEAKLAVRDNQEITEGQMLIVHRVSRSYATHSSSSGGSSHSAPGPQPITHDQVVTITPTGRVGSRTYRFAKDAKLNVRNRENVSAGKPLLKPRATSSQSEIAGTVSVDKSETGDSIVKVQGVHGDEYREYHFSRFERLVVKTGSAVKEGQELIQRHNTLGERFRWRVPPSAFLREMRSKLDEAHPWVNLSDGGHLENLATIELLRRRCKYIFIGDGEADPGLTFNGLATLIRFSRIDLGTEIDIDLDQLRLDRNGCSTVHWAIGRITYPKTEDSPEEETGYLLYLKSSYTGDEDAVIKEYRHRNPTFPHQTTADQMFDEGQFEAYRALGQHIAEKALESWTNDSATSEPMSYADLEKWMTDLWNDEQMRKKDARNEPADDDDDEA